MPKPRKQQIALDATPFYHCISRCVRRAFLCGIERYSGNSYEHRRQWVEERLIHCNNAFCIDIAAYAIMSNHYHLVLRVDSQAAEQLSDIDVVQRWHTLFAGTSLSRQYANGVKLKRWEWLILSKCIQCWRKRLCDISWMMRCINEPIARQANFEDHCTGHFWEGRFKCQALLDEAAILACMAYVDLNPIRASMATTPETSDYTSIKQRIAAVHKTPAAQPNYLLPLTGGEHRNKLAATINFELKDYIELLEQTGRTIREDKRGAIDQQLPPILQRLNISSEQWLLISTQFEQQFQQTAGSTLAMKLAAVTFNQQWFRKQSRSPIPVPI